MNSDTVKAVDPKAKEVRALMDMHSDAYDLGRAFEAASSNAEKSAESSYLLGLFQYTGTCTAADRDSAMASLKRAADGGYAPASIVLDEIARNPADIQDDLISKRLKAEQGEEAVTP